MNRAAVATAHCLLLLLVGSCGGGGGGEQSGGSGSPGLRVSTASVAVTADAGTPSTPTGSFTITVTNPPKDGVSIGGSFSQNGISNVGLEATSARTGTVTIFFRDPSVLGPGVFRDVLQLGICTDNNCTALIGGTQRTVDVTFTVTGTKPPQPTVTASTHFVPVQAAPFISASPEAIVTLTFQGVAASDVSINTDFTTNGLATVFSLPNASGGFDVNFWFKSSAELGVGTYVDTVTLNLCRFSSCPIELDGSPVVITTQFTVSGTVTGENGYTIRQVIASANDLVWDSVGGDIYLSVPSTAPDLPNSVVALEPVTGQLGASAFAGSDPTFGAVSDDGQFLYMGFAGSSSIQRFRLPGLERDITLPLGAYPSGPLFAGEIQVVPGQPRSIAVSRTPVGGYPSGYDVAVFDDAVQRPNAPHSDNTSNASIQFGATADVLYGSGSVISTMSIDSNGVNLVSSASITPNLGALRIHFDSGILYTDPGQAIDPVAGTLVGTYGIDMHGGEFGLGAAPDSGLNRIFFLISTGFSHVIRSYDLNTFTPIAEIRLDGVHFPFNQPLRIIRWGPDGLAVPTGDGRVLLITGPFVRP